MRVDLVIEDPKCIDNLRIHHCLVDAMRGGVTMSTGGSPGGTGFDTLPVTYKWLDSKQALTFSALVTELETLTMEAKSKIAQISLKRSAMSIGDMFDLQMSMNKLQQFSEMSTSVISAMNTAINEMSRNIK
jgi:hypothetical protein